jgi:uncharacterized integral membrane protein
MSTPSYHRELESTDLQDGLAETAEEALKRVRSRSCYHALRVVIWILVSPGYILAVIFLFAGGATGTVAASLLGGRAQTPLVIATPVYLGLAAGTILLTIALHQSFRVLVDIADLLIEQVRKK